MNILIQIVLGCTVIMPQFAWAQERGRLERPNAVVRALRVQQASGIFYPSSVEVGFTGYLPNGQPARGFFTTGLRAVGGLIRGAGDGRDRVPCEPGFTRDRASSNSCHPIDHVTIESHWNCGATPTNQPAAAGQAPLTGAILDEAGLCLALDPGTWVQPLAGGRCPSHYLRRRTAAAIRGDHDPLVGDAVCVVPDIGRYCPTTPGQYGPIRAVESPGFWRPLTSEAAPGCLDHRSVFSATDLNIQLVPVDFTLRGEVGAPSTAGASSGLVLDRLRANLVGIVWPAMGFRLLPVAFHVDNRLLFQNRASVVTAEFDILEFDWTDQLAGPDPMLPPGQRYGASLSVAAGAGIGVGWILESSRTPTDLLSGTIGFTYRANAGVRVQSGQRTPYVHFTVSGEVSQPNVGNGLDNILLQVEGRAALGVRLGQFVDLSLQAGLMRILQNHSIFRGFDGLGHGGERSNAALYAPMQPIDQTVVPLGAVLRVGAIAP